MKRLALIAGLVIAGCATPETDAEATADVEFRAPANDTTAPAEGVIDQSSEVTPPDEVTETPDVVVPPEEISWLPADDVTRRFAEWRRGDDAYRAVRETLKHTSTSHVLVAREWLVGADASDLSADADGVRQDFFYDTSADGVVMGLIEDGNRALPEPQLALRVPAAAGAHWTCDTPAGLIEVRLEAVESVATFAGTFENCARVGIARGTTKYVEWWAPDRGVVRVQTVDRKGHVLWGRALCGDELPPADRVRALFGAD